MDEPRILVVDDEPAAQRLLVRILEKKGYEAQAVGDVPSAVALLDREDFALVMTDLDMPGASGFELIETLSPRTPEVATILVTGRGNTEVASTALMSGAYGYLTKPFMPDEVEISVLNALRRRELELERRTHEQRLEETVRERTSDLARSLQQLQAAQEELRKKADELQELDRMKGQFIQVVSHELRTPLTIIRGGAQTILRAGDALDSKLRDDLLRSVESHANALGRMVNKILTAASLQRGDRESDFAVFDLAEIARRAVEEAAGEEASRIALDTREALGHGHEDLIRESARDLVENALIHTQGRITVSTSRVDGEAVFAVADEGPGISDDLLNRLLHEPFVQGDSSTTRRVGGLGLSLYLARQAAEISGGRFEARCTPSGSTFSLVLPADPVD